MPYYNTPNLSHKHFITPGLLVGIPPKFTGHPSYSDPLLPIIRIKSLDKSTTYYTYNAFKPSDQNPVIYCSVELSLDHHGVFELQIDDTDRELDTDLISNGARVEISMGKTNSETPKHLSGMIRQTGFTRGCASNLLYNISGFGTGVRFNERILDVIKDAPNTIDGTTVDTTDPDFAANKIVDDALDSEGFYPENVDSTEVDGTGGYGYINSSGTVVESPIKDFIPGVLLRFQEAEDLFNQIESYTGGRVYVDRDDKLQFQPTKHSTGVKGFRITTNINPDADLADSTIYVSSDNYSFSDSIEKNSGFSNSVYGILSASPLPDKDYYNDTGTYYANKTVEIAMRFKPITNPHWRLWCGVEGVGLTNIQSENSVRGRWRICEDNAGVPKNAGGIVANKYMYPNEFYNTADGGLQTIQVMGKGSVDLDENLYYWLILSSENSTSTEYWRWYYDDSLNAQTATASPGTSSSTDGGSGWSVSSDKRMLFTQTRFKAEAHCALDNLSVARRIRIESVLPSFPQQIVSKSGAIKYLLASLNQTSRPRRIFQFQGCSVPNLPIHPGDVACIVDSKFAFSNPGQRVVAGQVANINHTFGIKDGGSSSQSRGQTEMSLNVLAFPLSY